MIQDLKPDFRIVLKLDPDVQNVVDSLLCQHQSLSSLVKIGR